jgi:hypothetical protein
MTVHTIRGAFRDLNARGRGEETFRKVWRSGRWQWISSALPSGSFLAADRRAATKGDVETGEIIAQFSRQVGYGGSRACSIDGFYLVVDEETPLKSVEHTKPKLNVFAVEGQELPNPMARD